MKSLWMICLLAIVACTTPVEPRQVPPLDVLMAQLGCSYVKVYNDGFQSWIVYKCGSAEDAVSSALPEVLKGGTCEAVIVGRSYGYQCEYL